MPLLSVIIPIYNKAQYLPELWRLLRDQSFKDFECLIIDDGSTDESGNLCDLIANQDKRFLVSHQINAGVSAARNKGLDCASGDYITFIDADDSFHKDYLMNMVNCISCYKADMVIASCQKVWKQSEQTERIEAPGYGLFTMDDLIANFAEVQQSSGIYGYCWGKILSRQLIGECRFTEGIRLAEDLDFYLSIYPKIHTIYFDDKVYYNYLQAAQNSSMLEEDWEIDYFTQLKIQLKLYRFLMQFESGKTANAEVMTRRLYDYVFFCLFHSPKAEIDKMYNAINNLDLPSYSASARPWQQKSILTLFAHHQIRLLKFEILFYRKLKGIQR